MERKILDVFLTLIDKSTDEEFYTQGEIIDLIKRKFNYKYERKSIGTALEIIEINYKDDLKNLGYKFERGPHNRGARFVRINN